ncbi:MAG: MGMT family protein [Atopobiaceae bacterium]|nr:MGMT family protein [Atopobiaceae bacterium]
MGAFFDKVYDAVRLIPRGYVATYGDVARVVGRPRSARYVGYALHSNPHPGDEIPCHRVVFADGHLSEGFAFGGPEVQRMLLESEGVPFEDADHVDLEQCRFDFATDALGRPLDIDWAAELGE